MLKIYYGNYKNAISDFEAKSYVKTIIDLYKNKFPDMMDSYISNEVVLNEFVLSVMKGEISENEVEFYYKNKKLNFDSYLGLEEPEDDKMFGIHANTVNEIIEIGYKKMKARNSKLK